MQLLDSQNTVLKTNEVITYLYRCVLAEPAITDVVAEIEPDLQFWGSSALHFAARHLRTRAPALLKVHVPPDQIWWTRQLAQLYPELLPNVYATGVLTEHGLGWILWERIQGGLHSGWQGREFDLLLEAGVSFQVASRSLRQAAQNAGVLRTLRVADLAEQLEQGIARAAPGPAQQLLNRLSIDWAWVTSICEAEVCHGDLHMANALCRSLPPQGVALLIDHHPILMPWACEAAKPEILNAQSSRIGCRGLVVQQASIRARHGLSTVNGADLARLQAIVLGWWAIQIWAVIGPAPDPTWRDPQIWHAENQAYITAAART